MLVAGETSSDQLAAQLADELRAELGRRCEFAPRIFGAGGPKMAAAGVEVCLDLVKHALIGIPSPKQIAKFTGFRDQLFQLAMTRCPDVVIGVDSFALNGSLAEKIRTDSGRRQGAFFNWNPRLVQFVSPQVWASRPKRAQRLERTHDLLLSILPFEKEWYSRHAPKLHVNFVGNPLVDRFLGVDRNGGRQWVAGRVPLVLLLPGSRRSELKRHWPVLIEAAKQIHQSIPTRFRAVLPNETLLGVLNEISPTVPGEGVEIERVVGGLSGSLSEAALAMASTGTVTVECAWFGVPTVAIYKTNWTTYQIGKRIVTVPFLSMPNLLAGKSVMPEFVQEDATPAAVAGAALALLSDHSQWEHSRAQLLETCATLGTPGACRRAACAISDLI